MKFVTESRIVFSIHLRKLLPSQISKVYVYLAP